MHLLRSDLLIRLVAAATLSTTNSLAQSVDEKPKQMCVVGVVGDSLSDPRSGGAKYLDWLRLKAPKSEFHSFGAGGRKTQDMRRHFVKELFGTGKTPARAYTHVIVFGGINDLLSSSVQYAPISPIQTNLTAIYDALHEKGIKVVAVTVTPWGKSFAGDQRIISARKLNEWMLELPKEGKTDFAVDIRPAVTCGDPDTTCVPYRRSPTDQVHWNSQGHEKVGEVLWNKVFSECE